MAGVPQFNELRKIVLESEQYEDMPAEDKDLTVQFFNSLDECARRHANDRPTTTNVRRQLEFMAPVIEAARPLKKYKVMDIICGAVCKACQESVGELAAAERGEMLDFLGSVMLGGNERSAFM